MAGYPLRHLVALRLTDPQGWERLVRGALERTLDTARAAQDLGVSRRTLQRWTAEVPALVAGLELPERWERMAELQRGKRSPVSGSKKSEGQE